MKGMFALVLLVALFGCKSTGASESEVKNAGPLEEKVDSLFKTTEGVAYALKSGLVTSQYAKEVCSCVFLAKLDHKTCIARSNMYVTELAVTAEIDVANKRVRGVGKKEAADALAQKFGVDPQAINPPFTAEFRAEKPELGCRITSEPHPISTSDQP